MNAAKTPHAPLRGSGSVGLLRRLVGGLDPAILISTLALVAYGLLVVYSASLSIPEASAPRQALGVAIGLVLLAVASKADCRLLANYTWALFVLDCLLMAAPFIPGLSYHANGLTGWVKIPVIGQTFQTSELAKPVTIMLMAALGARYGGRIDRLGDYLKLCAVLAVPFALILLQPDLGTGLVILFSGAVVIVMAGPRRSWVLWTIGIIVVVVALIIVSDSVIDAAVGDERSIIKNYQMNRLLVFINPDADTTGAGYNLKQAMIAVGSGGLFGKGIGNATQASSGFLPEAHTDFAFALLSEEFGFVGAIGLIALYAVLVLSTLRLAFVNGNLFSKLVLAGVAAMWTFQIFENIGMCLSLMPITGIPLPFISFGSSSMIVQLLTVGIVLSVGSRDGREGISE